MEDSAELKPLDMRKLLLFVVLNLFCQYDHALRLELPQVSGNSTAPSTVIQQQLYDVYKEKRGTYTVRTRYLDENGYPIYSNRLLLEDSPYLLQHAHNPVNWYPFGAEAFEKAAKKANRSFSPLDIPPATGAM